MAIFDNSEKSASAKVSFGNNDWLSSTIFDPFVLDKQVVAKRNYAIPPCQLFESGIVQGPPLVIPHSCYDVALQTSLSFGYGQGSKEAFEQLRILSSIPRQKKHALLFLAHRRKDRARNILKGAHSIRRRLEYPLSTRVNDPLKMQVGNIPYRQQGLMSLA